MTCAPSPLRWRTLCSGAAIGLAAIAPALGLDIGNARFAANVRACEGYAIVSEIAGVDSFVLVSGPEAEVQRLMLCPGAARAARPPRDGEESVMMSKVFEVMKLLESRRISLQIRRPGPLDLVFTAIQVGKRVEITVDENEIVNVCVFRGDEAVEVGMDEVLKALEEDG